MSGEKEADDLVLDDPKEQPNAGNEAEADANDQDGEDDADGSEGEGAQHGDGAEAEGEGEVEEVRRPSRGEVRFQKLSATAREATERATKLENETRELRDRLARLEQPRQEQPRGKSPEELALMTPDELIDYRLGIATKGFEQKLGAIQWATYETNDKSAFAALCATDPVAARYKDEVEQRLTAMRQAGQNVDRERLLTYIIGEKVRQRNAGAKDKQRNEGQRRIQRQQVRPAQSRGDTQSNRGRASDAEALEKRLENVTF